MSILSVYTDKAGNLYRCCIDKALRRQQILKLLLIIVCTVLLPGLWPFALANEKAGGGEFDPNDAEFQSLVATCLDCHAVDDATEAVGPTLQGIFGRRTASISEYGYSAALYEKAAIGMIWDEPTLDEFLAAPQVMIPGIAMIYDGISDPDDRAELIAWLASGPMPLSVATPESIALPFASDVAVVLNGKADLEYGEYLAGQCLTCHSAPGSADSVPPIKGLPAAYFINALLEYQRGERSNPVMQTMSESLGVEELAALASFFAVPSL